MTVSLFIFVSALENTFCSLNKVITVIKSRCFHVEQPEIKTPPPDSYHDKGAVEVETLPAAFGHHVPGPPLSVLQHGPREQQQAEAGVQTQEQQLPAVVVPVGSSQVARSVTLLLIQIRRLQPVRSTEERTGDKMSHNTKRPDHVSPAQPRHWLPVRLRVNMLLIKL